MKLHILRHAETDTYSESGADIDRKLLPKGIEQASDMRSYFEGIEGIQTIWCSEAYRTRQTAEIVLSENHPKPEYYLDLHLAPKQMILQMLWNFNSSGDLLIIGHNFGISDLVRYFSEENIELRTAEYVCIEFDSDSWAESSMGTGAIVDRYRPKVSS